MPEFSQDEEKRREYEAREKAIRDYNQGILEAELRGEARGAERGKEEITLTSIKNLMETLHLTADQAMAALKIPQERYKKYKEKLARG